MVQKLQIAKNVLKRLRKRAFVAHVADHKNTLIYNIDRTYEPKGRLKTQRINQTKNCGRYKCSDTSFVWICNNE